MCLGFSMTVPAPSGPNPIISALPFRFPNGPFAKVFYPAAKGVTSQKTYREALGEAATRIKELFGYSVSNSGRYRYTRKGVVKGMAKWLGSPAWFFRWSLGSNTPNHRLLLEPKEEQYPVIVFSHGLGGNADIYSKFCTDMASHGYIVIALEHEDGSGSFAVAHDTKEEIFFKSPPKFEYNRENVINFRAPFLKKRQEEVEIVLNFLLSCQNNIEEIPEETFKLNPELEKKVFKMMKPNDFHLAGHSFGGASSVMVAHAFAKKPADDPFSNIFKTVTLLDVWPFPIPTEVLEDGLQVPFISMLSERFSQNDEFIYSQVLVEGSNCKMFAYLKGVTHTQYSDGPWFVGWRSIRKRFEMEGSMRGVQSQGYIIHAASEFLKSPEDFSIDKLEGTEFNILDSKTAKGPKHQHQPAKTERLNS